MYKMMDGTSDTSAELRKLSAEAPLRPTFALLSVCAPPRALDESPRCFKCSSNVPNAVDALLAC